jgi:hypothetical protein
VTGSIKSRLLLTFRTTPATGRGIGVKEEDRCPNWKKGVFRPCTVDVSSDRNEKEATSTGGSGMLRWLKR